jgi:hypothetical protein
MASGDVLMQGVTTNSGEDTYWFQFYNAYYLRGRTDVKPSIIHPSYFPQSIKAEGGGTGRLWVMLTIGPADQADFERVADPAYQIRCWQLICLFAEKADQRGSIKDQAARFLSHFARLNPEEFRIAGQALATIQSTNTQ